MKTIAIAAQKGGVGKTTTALATAEGIAEAGARVLLVDLDPQGNATISLAIPAGFATSYGVMRRICSLSDAAIPAGRFDALRSDEGAAAADIALTATGKEHMLEEVLAGAGYDYCVIDTPPSLGILTINALTAADYAVIPAEADIYSLGAIARIAPTLESVRRYTNSRLKVAGILLTRFNARTALSRDATTAAEESARALGTALFDSRIREAVAVKEAHATRRGLLEYAPRSKVAADYRAYIAELLERMA